MFAKNECLYAENFEYLTSHPNLQVGLLDLGLE